MTSNGCKDNGHDLLGFSFQPDDEFKICHNSVLLKDVIEKHLESKGIFLTNQYLPERNQGSQT